ncbi:LuxR C-terminal-related transcriptional regulator [Pseudomonas sp. GX19020]|uniref:LuxR C-terminal-related transcriptional regulator n=1 Tax=Pseudomonas sp. GX19020 TaxID=2942277 RepID=UPI002018E961|nr:LuxR C-terminal-related transcriptional regulator [Pseudomonas sp. GX19020]MCL4068410.1 LuxR C-terminal-related transcriptional regulator [Pseudomonas sp. GX19020]
MATVIDTKIHPPLLRSTLLRREATLALMDQALAHPLTVLRAPAGFGKTTLVAQWGAGLEETGFAWLSLDPMADSGRSFILHLIRAVGRALPTPDIALQNLITSESLSATGALAALVAAVLAAGRPLVLVLDDLHRLTSAEALAFLQSLIDHAPSRLHIVLISRSDPPLHLAHLRARGQLVRIPDSALRFSRAETADFLHESLGLTMEPAELTTLHTRTEGWIAALQLAGLAMNEEGDRPGFLARFSGAGGDIAAFLGQEVLSRLPADMMDFLSRSAVLEWFDADLAARVTGHKDAAAMIRRIDQANLFLVALTPSRTTFRYHHLFADLLRSLPRTAELAPALNRAAADCLSARGLEIDAVHYALAAGDTLRAAELVETCCMAAVKLGQITRLRAWLERLPPGVNDSRPRLLLAQAWVYFHSSAPRRALTCVRAARDLLRQMQSDAALPRETHAALWAEMQVLGVGALSAGERSARARRMALALLPTLPHQEHFLRGTLNNVLGFCEYSLGSLGPARLACSRGRAAHEQAGSVFGMAYSELILGLIEKSAGNLQIARQHFASGADMAREALGAGSYAEAMAAVFQAELAYESDNLDAAARHLADHRGEMEAFGLVVHEMTVRLSAARLSAARGETAAAIAILSEAEVSGARNHYRRLVASALNDHVRLLLAGGNAALARGVLMARGVSEDSSESPGAPSTAHEMEQIALSRVLIAEGTAAAAHERLTRIVGRLRYSGRLRRLVQVQAVNAIAALNAGERMAALNAISEAVETAFRQGALRSLLDEGAALARVIDWARPRIPSWSRDVALSAFVTGLHSRLAPSATAAGPQTQAAPPLLSPKEAEVAAALQAGASNREISEQLAISMDTVKWHLKNIFSKLGVSSRIQAVLALSARGDRPHPHPKGW